jgi:hypothetical protein
MKKYISVGFFFFKVVFGLKERKWEERKLCKLMNEFGLIFVQIHLLD